MNKLQLQSIVAAQLNNSFRREREADCVREVTVVDAEGRERVPQGQCVYYRREPHFVLPNPAPEVVDKQILCRQMSEFMQNRFDADYCEYREFLSMVVRHTRLAQYIKRTL